MSSNLATVFVLLATTGWLLYGCMPPAGQGQESDLLLINGKTVAEEEYPAVYSIGGCTATFVSDSTMITAGHCVRPNGTITLRKRSDARSTKIIRHPRYTGVGLYDTAVVLFPPGTSKNWIPVQTEPLAANDDVLMVGYGCTLSSGKSGIKRVGTNRVEAIRSGSVMLRRPTTAPESGEGVTLCPGDSGGPMFKKDTLVGIASFWDGKSGRVSGHADLTNKVNQDFLKDTIELGAKINFANGNNNEISDDAPLFIALRESGASSSLRTIGSAPKKAVKMRLCPQASGQTCEAATTGAIEALANGRQTNERSFFDLDGVVAVGSEPRFVLVALDASEKIIGRRIFTLKSP